VTYPAGARLGMSVIKRDDEGSPLLGSTLIESVESTGYSKIGGVQAGDFIMSVNEQYVAFQPNVEVVQLLQRDLREQKEITIYFARPNRMEWQQICSSGEVPIREGTVNKLQTGIFRKWNSRELRLTRTHLHYLADGATKGKYSVDGELGWPKLAAGYPLHQGVFEMKCGDKDFVIQTHSPHARNLWLHALECALNKTFNRPLPGSYGGGGGVIQAPPHVQIPNQNRASQSYDDPSQSSYLKLGSSNVLENGNGHAHAHATHHSPKVSSSAQGANQGVYKILSLSRVQAVAGPDTVIKLEGVKDPISIAPALLDYDFQLEERVLHS